MYIYIYKVLNHFYMNNEYPSNSPMVAHSYEVKKDPFHPCEE